MPAREPWQAVVADGDRGEHGYPRPPSQPHQKVVSDTGRCVTRRASLRPVAYSISRTRSRDRARSVWQGDGEQWIDAMVRRWTRSAVIVTFGDERPRTIGVRLAASMHDSTLGSKQQAPLLTTTKRPTDPTTVGPQHHPGSRVGIQGRV
jgi:hypothetical protein